MKCDFARQKTHLEMDMVFLNVIKPVRIAQSDIAELTSKNYERIGNGNHRKSMISIN